MDTFNITAFNGLPSGLKKSDYVDMLLLINGDKPCARLGQNNHEVYEKINCWCKKNKYYGFVSNANLFYVSKFRVLAKITQLMDDSSFNHTFILGLLLGYPVCCCKKIADVKEENIDTFEEQFINSGIFEKPYDIISPEGYRQGTSLISHIPCSCTCRKSLKIAAHSLQIVNKLICFSFKISF